MFILRRVAQNLSTSSNSSQTSSRLVHSCATGLAISGDAFDVELTFSGLWEDSLRVEVLVSARTPRKQLGRVVRCQRLCLDKFRALWTPGSRRTSMHIPLVVCNRTTHFYVDKWHEITQGCLYHGPDNVNMSRARDAVVSQFRSVTHKQKFRIRANLM